MLIKSTPTNLPKRKTQSQPVNQETFLPKTVNWDARDTVVPGGLFDLNTFDSTSKFLKKSQKLAARQPDKTAVFPTKLTFSDNSVTKPRTKRQRQLDITRGIASGAAGGALFFGFATMLGAAFGGSGGDAETWLSIGAGALALGAGVGGYVGGQHAAEKYDVYKRVEGEVTVKPDGNATFRPDSKPELEVNLNDFAQAKKPSKDSDGQYQFGNQWWNMPGVSKVLKKKGSHG